MTHGVVECSHSQNVAQTAQRIRDYVLLDYVAIDAPQVSFRMVRIAFQFCHSYAGVYS